MEIEKEKYKNDKIIKFSIEMIDKINKMLQDDNINKKEYEELINYIESMIESRIAYLNFWED